MQRFDSRNFQGRDGGRRAMSDLAIRSFDVIERFGDALQRAVGAYRAPAKVVARETRVVEARGAENHLAKLNEPRLHVGLTYALVFPEALDALLSFLSERAEDFTPAQRAIAEKHLRLIAAAAEGGSAAAAPRLHGGGDG
jgi:hypothetical protein